MLEFPLTSVKGIGPKRAELFEKLGVSCVRDLLFRLPRDYLDYTKATPISQLVNGRNAAVQVRVSGAVRFFRKKGMTMLSAPAQDETGKITLKWFNQAYRSSQLQIGEIIYASGRVVKKNGVSLINPSLSQALPGIVPVYPTVKGVNQRAWRDSIFACLESVWDKIPEPLPRTILERYSLVPPDDAAQSGSRGSWTTLPRRLSPPFPAACERRMGRRSAGVARRVARRPRPAAGRDAEGAPRQRRILAAGGALRTRRDRFFDDRRARPPSPDANPRCLAGPARAPDAPAAQSAHR